MIAFQHGVSITERPTALIAPITSESAVQIVVGIAPVNMVDDGEDPLKPKLVTTYDEAVKKLGFLSDIMTYTICQSMVASFQIYNVSPIIFINVLGQSKHKVEMIYDEVPISGKAFKLQEKGLMLNGLRIQSIDGLTTFTSGVDYVPEFTEDGTLNFFIPEDSLISQESVKITCTKLDPSLVTEEDFIASIEKIKQVHPLYSIVPCTLICPGWSGLPAVYSAMIAQAENLNGCFRYISISDLDTSVADTYDKCRVEKDTNNIVSSQCIATWPMVKNGSRIFYQSTILAAHMAYVDYLNDGVPYNSPSNKSYRISALCDSQGKEIILDMEQANLLNSQGILTAINFNGWKCWGNRTAVYPASSDVKDVFISVRRMFNWWCNTFILTYFQKVDEPMNRKLIESIVDSENIRANGFKSRSQIAEAGVEFSIEDNPDTDLIAGIIRLKMWLTPFPPAESIRSTIEYNVSALSASLSEGGN